MKPSLGWSLTFSCWLAAFTSWNMGNHLGWVIFHFFCGSAYLAYWLVFYVKLVERVLP